MNRFGVLARSARYRRLGDSGCGAQTAVNVTPPNLSGHTTGSLTGQLSVSPSISLHYNSQAGMDILVLGSGIACESQFNRCAKTLATDSERRPVMFNAQCADCLDRKRRIYKSGTTHPSPAARAPRVASVKNFSSSLHRFGRQCVAFRT